MTPDNQLAKGLYLIASEDLVRNRFGRAVIVEASKNFEDRERGERQQIFAPGGGRALAR